jgi:hypothetical protein
MDSVKNNDKVRRNVRLAQILGLIGLAAMIAGVIIVLFFDRLEGFGITPNQALLLQLGSLGLALLLTQVSAYLGNQYGRRPRADEALDEALRKVVKAGRIYHWVLPAAHVLLTPAGIIIFHVKYQIGDVSVRKDQKGNDRWSQKRVGVIRRFVNQENVGNPTREADILVQKMANFVRKHAPGVEEVPIGLVIVFTAQRSKDDAYQLDLKESSFPALHVTKLRGYVRQKGAGEPLAEEVQAELRQAFDNAAASLLDEKGEPLYA